MLNRNGNEYLNKSKSRALEALSEDMQRDASPIRRELDALILEAQARSDNQLVAKCHQLKMPAPYEK